jgi:hypothetical protein
MGNIEGLIGNAFGPNRTYAYSWNTITYAMGSHDHCGNLCSQEPGSAAGTALAMLSMSRGPRPTAASTSTCLNRQ